MKAKKELDRPNHLQYRWLQARIAEAEKALVKKHRDKLMGRYAQEPAHIARARKLIRRWDHQQWAREAKARKVIAVQVEREASKLRGSVLFLNPTHAYLLVKEFAEKAGI